MTDTYPYADTGGLARAPGLNRRSRPSSVSSRTATLSQTSVYLEQYVVDASTTSPNSTYAPPPGFAVPVPARTAQSLQSRSQRARGPSAAQAAVVPRITLRPASTMRTSSPNPQPAPADSRAPAIITLKPRTDARSGGVDGGVARLARAGSTASLYASDSPERRVLTLRPASRSPERRLQQFSPGARSQTLAPSDATNWTAELRRAQTLRSDASSNGRAHTINEYSSQPPDSRVYMYTVASRDGRAVASRPASVSPRRTLAYTFVEQEPRAETLAQTDQTLEFSFDEPHVYENVPVLSLASPPARPESVYSTQSVYLQREQLSPPFAEATLGVRPQDEALEPTFALSHTLPSQDAAYDVVRLPLATYSIIHESEEEHLYDKGAEQFAKGAPEQLAKAPEQLARKRLAQHDFVEYYRFVRAKREQHESDVSVPSAQPHTLTLAGTPNGGVGPATLESKEVPPAPAPPKPDQWPHVPEAPDDDPDNVVLDKAGPGVRAKRSPQRTEVPPAPSPPKPDQWPHVPEAPDDDPDNVVLDKAGPGVRSKKSPHKTMARTFESRGFQAAGPVMNDDGVQHSPQLSSYWCSPPFVAAPDDDTLDAPDRVRSPRTARPRSALKKPRADDEPEPHKRPVSPGVVAAGDLHPLDDCGVEFELQERPMSAASELVFERGEKGVQATPHVHHVGVGKGGERELRSCASATDEVPIADFAAGVHLPYSVGPPPSWTWQAREFPPGMQCGEHTPVVDERVRTPPHKSPSEPHEWLLEPLDARARRLLVPQSTQEPELRVEQRTQTDPLLYRRDVVMQTGAQRAVGWERLDWRLELFERWQTSPPPRDLYCILFTTPAELIAPAERSPNEPLPAAEHEAVQTDAPVECVDACEGPTPEHRHSACVQTGLEVDFGERFFESPELRPSMAIAEPYERLLQWPPPPARTVAIQCTLQEQAVGVQTDELPHVCDVLVQAGQPFGSRSPALPLPPDSYAVVAPGEPFELIPPLKAKRTQKAHKATQTGEQIECQDASSGPASVAQRHVCLATQADSLYNNVPTHPVNSYSYEYHWSRLNENAGDELVQTELVPLLTYSADADAQQFPLFTSVRVWPEWRAPACDEQSQAGPVSASASVQTEPLRAVRDAIVQVARDDQDGERWRLRWQQLVEVVWDTRPSAPDLPFMFLAVGPPTLVDSAPEPPARVPVGHKQVQTDDLIECVDRAAGLDEEDVCNEESQTEERDDSHPLYYYTPSLIGASKLPSVPDLLGDMQRFTLVTSLFRAPYESSFHEYIASPSRGTGQSARTPALQRARSWHVVAETSAPRLLVRPLERPPTRTVAIQRAPLVDSYAAQTDALRYVREFGAQVESPPEQPLPLTVSTPFLLEDNDRRTSSLTRTSKWLTSWRSEGEVEHKAVQTDEAVAVRDASCWTLDGEQQSTLVQTDELAELQLRDYRLPATSMAASELGVLPAGKTALTRMRRGSKLSQAGDGTYVVTRPFPRPPTSDKSQLALVEQASRGAATDALLSMREVGAQADSEFVEDEQLGARLKKPSERVRARRPPGGPLVTVSGSFLVDPVSHDGTRQPSADMDTQTALMIDALDACVGPTAGGRRHFSCQASGLSRTYGAELIEYPPSTRIGATSFSSGFADDSSGWDADTESSARWTQSLSAEWERDSAFQEPFVVLRAWPPPETRRVQLQVALYQTADRETQTEPMRLVRDVLVQAAGSSAQGAGGQMAAVFAIVAVGEVHVHQVVRVSTEHKATQTEQRVLVVDGAYGPTPEDEDALWSRELQTDDPDAKPARPTSRPVALLRGASILRQGASSGEHPSQLPCVPYEVLQALQPPPTRTVALQKGFSQTARETQTERQIRVREAGVQVAPDTRAAELSLFVSSSAVFYLLIGELAALRTEHKAVQVIAEVECRNACVGDEREIVARRTQTDQDITNWESMTLVSRAVLEDWGPDPFPARPWRLHEAVFMLEVQWPKPATKNVQIQRALSAHTVSVEVQTEEEEEGAVRDVRAQAGLPYFYRGAYEEFWARRRPADEHWAHKQTQTYWEEELEETQELPRGDLSVISLGLFSIAATTQRVYSVPVPLCTDVSTSTDTEENAVSASRSPASPSQAIGQPRIVCARQVEQTSVEVQTEEPEPEPESEPEQSEDESDEERRSSSSGSVRWEVVSVLDPQSVREGKHEMIDYQDAIARKIIDVKKGIYHGPDGSIPIIQGIFTGLIIANMK